ncbi:unnamed protein product [Rotaria magnacalcarata]|uniref:Uncharacterized protein n=2 Tax=Rotaria magnacalcarata TaxID=392030 RepID=A0A819GII2_9BILA|nr:unnamed protein product [Rotaria magnacalcarata]CAF3793091.1 unnamed protein product [Rotaria magnacalcarata]CAF3886391.1 unnamed protein product [Rotaria magnacalcarata]
MNPSKRFKNENSNKDSDDDIIIIESTKASIIHEYCQHIDNIAGESCREYYAMVCTHCNLYLCYIHVEIHRVLLINERDKLVNELNERIEEINQLIENPDRIQQLLIEQIENRKKTKVSFIHQLSLEKLINISKIINDLKQLFEPIRIVLQKTRCVSSIQIKKIQETFLKFDENKKILINNIVDSITIKQHHSANLFQLSNLDRPCRQYELPVHHSVHNEMAASEDVLVINDREHVLLFNLTNCFDDTLIPELIEWKNCVDGKIVDIQYSLYFKLFFILTDEKLFSLNRLSSLVCLYRFTSLPWSCTIMLNSIYILYKYSTIIEQWTFQQASSIQLVKQWKLNEILTESEYDQHLKCIRSNPSQNQLAILIEDDECRWRIALFDHDMNYLHQTNMLPNASTIDWNLIFSFISDQQLIVMDTTTETIYLITINECTSTINYQQYSNSDYPANAYRHIHCLDEVLVTVLCIAGYINSSFCCQHSCSGQRSSSESYLDPSVSKSSIDAFVGSFQHNAIIHVPANVKGVDTVVITKNSSTSALVNIRLVIPYGGHVCAFGYGAVKFDYDSSNNRLIYEPCKLYITESKGALTLHDPNSSCLACNNMGVFDGLVFQPGSPAGSIDDFIGSFYHPSINGNKDTAVIVKQTSTIALLSLSGLLPGGKMCSLNAIKVEYVPNTVPPRLLANGYVDCALYFTQEKDGKLTLRDPSFNCARNNCGVFELWEGSVFQKD